MHDADAAASGRLSSPDDVATEREAQFLAWSLAEQQRRAAAQAASTPGTCRYCGQAVASLAVYCDADCRADHEAEQRTLRRQGRAP